MTTTINKKDFGPISSYLPHSGKMVLLDKVLTFDRDNTELTTEVVIKKESMFFDPQQNCVPVWVGIEYMAQSIAAFANIYNASAEEPKIGFLLGARKYTCHANGFLLNQKLQIKVRQLFNSDNLGSFECIITAKNEILAEARISVYQPDSIENFLQEQHND